jgi:hypothetical protein
LQKRGVQGLSGALEQVQIILRSVKEHGYPLNAGQ